VRCAGGRTAGGRAHGYDAVLLPDGRTEVVRDERGQARHVPWIFERYAEGWSPRRIAAELNTRGAPRRIA